MTKNEKKKLQEKQLEMLDEIDRICKKHKLKFWLDSGTALGAIRHKGFIPWDDDVDIGMLREDYDKFIEVCKTELDDKFFIQNTESENEYPLEFAKMRMNYTLFDEKLFHDKNLHKGIFIDIFPYDATSNNKYYRTFLQYKTAFPRIMILHKLGYPVKPRSKAQAIVIKCLFILSHFVSIKRLRKNVRKYYNKYPNTTEYVACFVGTNLMGNIHKRSIFEKTVRKPFEDRKYPVMKEYDQYLTNGYGDYMTPPPEKEREIGHNVLAIKFKTKNKKGY